jgi:hypothetical protein
MLNHTNKIINNSIKIIYKKNNGQTIKNAIMSKKECENYNQIQSKNKTKNETKNKTKKNNINNNKNLTQKLNNISKKCLIKSKLIKSQPNVIFTNDEENSNYSYLIVLISKKIIPDEEDEDKKQKKYINWVAIINDNKVDKNIIKYSLNTTKSIYNFTIRIYRFPKKYTTIINKIENIVKHNQNKIIKKLKLVKDLERIYTNNFGVKHTKNALQVLKKLFTPRAGMGRSGSGYRFIGLLGAILSSIK